LTKSSALAYLPVEMPTGDYYGGHRPGAGLFGEKPRRGSICRTGKAESGTTSFGAPRHLGHGHSVARRFLPTSRFNGRTVKACSASRPSRACSTCSIVCDRPARSGRFEEASCSARRRARRMVLAGRKPFPTKPPPYERTGVRSRRLDRLHGPALRAERPWKLVKKYKMGPMFTPPVVSKVEGPACAAHTARWRARNWKGGSYDPETQPRVRLFHGRDRNQWGLVPPPAGFSDMRYISGKRPSRVARLDRRPAVRRRAAGRNGRRQWR